MNTSIDNMPCCPDPIANVVTIQNITGLKKYSNAIVRVLDIETTFYVDPRHRVTVIAAGIVETNSYDTETNPTNFRNQLIYDKDYGTLFYFTNKGTAITVSSGSSSDFNKLSNRPLYDNQPMTGATNIPKVPTDINELAGTNTLKTGITENATNIATEITNRENADISLQQQIDGIVSSTDVRDVVNTYADLEAYDTSILGNNDIIKVLNDETHDGAISYYRYDKTANTFKWEGSVGPYYTKSEADNKFLDKTAIDSYATNEALAVGLSQKQDTLISATNIKTINGASILGEGDLEVSGGSDVQLYDNYSTATDGANTAAFINTLLNGQTIKIGNGATASNDSNIAIGNTAKTTGTNTLAIGVGAQATSINAVAIGTAALATGRGISIGQLSKTDFYSVSIGYGTQAYTDSIAIGDFANAGDDQGISIGSHSKATNTLSISIGVDANSSHTNSIALGRGSQTSRNMEVSINNVSGETTYNRFLTGVKAGELPTDAINLQQLQDTINGTILYEGTSSTNNITLSATATSYARLEIVAEYMGAGSSVLGQQVVVTFYPDTNAKAFQINATDLTVSDIPVETTIQDIWSLSESGTELDLVSSAKCTKEAGSLTCTQDTTSIFTITKIIGFGKKPAES